VFIRYFARTDDTDLGRVAAEYCDALVGTGIPVRLVSTRVAELQLDARGHYKGAWHRHRQLLITPMDGGFVNVVCGEPRDWTRFHTPSAINVLLLTEQNLAASGASQPELIEAVTLFRVIYAPTNELAEVAYRVTGFDPLVAQLGTKEAGEILRATFVAHGPSAFGNA
jgi:hypothetical protein